MAAGRRSIPATPGCVATNPSPPTSSSTSDQWERCVPETSGPPARTGSMFARLRPQARRGHGVVEYLRVLETPVATESTWARPRAVPSVGPPPGPTPGQMDARRHRVRLLVEDLETGERVVLAGSTTWRSIEVLGSA